MRETRFESNRLSLDHAHKRINPEDKPMLNELLLIILLEQVATTKFDLCVGAARECLEASKKVRES